MRIRQSVTFATLIATGIAVAALPSLAQAQQKFPTKPVRIVLPSSAGGGVDSLARIVVPKLSESWGRPVVIDNRPGGGGTLGALQVAKAAPDGHTLLYAAPNFVISAALQPNLPYDPLKDFAGIGQMAFGITVLVVAPALGVKSVTDLIALAKAQPGKIIFGSSAVGTGPHLTGARFNRAAGIKVVTVAFKGASEATMQILGGRTHYSFLDSFSALPFIKDGKLLALAVNTPQRSPALADVPALAETLPDFKRSGAFSHGLLAPAGTPRPILNQISKEFARILDLPDVKERLQGVGFTPAPTTPEEYDRILREQIQILSKLAVDAGLKAK